MEVCLQVETKFRNAPLMLAKCFGSYAFSSRRVKSDVISQVIFVLCRDFYVGLVLAVSVRGFTMDG